MRAKKREIDIGLLHKLEEQAREIGRLIGGVTPPGCGFALMLFSYQGSEMTWISNAQRADMIKALEEFIAHLKAGTADELSRPKGQG